MGRMPPHKHLIHPMPLSPPPPPLPPSLFSPWSLNTSPLGSTIADLSSVPLDSYPLGSEYISTYLSPLWSHLSASPSASLHTSTSAVSVCRLGSSKGSMLGRTGKFRVLASREGGKEELFECDRIADCTGTWGNRNWMGEGGMPAVGERKLGERGGRGTFLLFL